LPKIPDLTSKQIENIVTDYLEPSSLLTKIAKNYHRTGRTIRQILLDNNIELHSKLGLRRKYILNQDFFETIDTEEKAYFLGLLFADGYHDEKRHVISLSLKNTDIDILLKFKKALETTYVLHTRPQRTGIPCTDLSLFSVKMSNDLIKLGLRQKKSFTCEFPDVPKHLVRHVIRGYFDGDGSIFIITQRHRVGCTILGNKQFLEKIISHLPFKNKIKVHPQRSIFYMNMSNRVSLVAIYRYLYSDAHVFMNRKYDKWQDCIRILVNKPQVMKHKVSHVFPNRIYRMNY